MSKQIILAILIIFTLIQATEGKSNSLRAVTTPTPQNKIRFVTESNSYVGSFSSSRKGLNYKKIQTALSEHFSQQMEQSVSGSIWENCDEGFEVMFPAYNMKNEYIGSVRVGNKFFVSDGNFYYHVGELVDSLEEALGFQVQIIGIREKGDNSYQETIWSGDSMMYLKL